MEPFSSSAQGITKFTDQWFNSRTYRWEQKN